MPEKQSGSDSRNFAPSENEQAESIRQAVQLYRQKDYASAQTLFENLQTLRPEDSKVVYYLALCNAQQRNFGEAARLYEEVVRRDKGGKLKALAEEGLKALPISASGQDGLDAPPQFSSKGLPLQTGSKMPLENRGDGSTFTGVSPADWMLWQSVMGNNNGNNNSNNSWMPGSNDLWGAMPYPGPGMPGNNGAAQIDPQVMSQIMMNQMMQNTTQLMNPNSDRDNR